MSYYKPHILFAKSVTGSTGGGGYDADAQAFFDVNTGLSTTIKDATNQAVDSIKSANLWTALPCIYPFVGGTFTSHKWNLKDPRDLDAAYRLSILGGATANTSQGIILNGTNEYIDTHFAGTSFSGIKNWMFGWYGNEPIMLGAAAAMGVADYGDSKGCQFLDYAGYDRAVSNDGQSYRLHDTLAGFICVGEDTNGIQLYKNGTSIVTTTGSSTVSGLNSGSIFLGARHIQDDAVIADSYIGINLRFAFIANRALTSSEVSTLYSIIQTFQTSLSRQL